MLPSFFCPDLLNLIIFSISVDFITFGYCVAIRAPASFVLLSGAAVAAAAGLGLGLHRIPDLRGREGAATAVAGQQGGGGAASAEGGSGEGRIRRRPSSALVGVGGGAGEVVGGGTGVGGTGRVGRRRGCSLAAGRQLWNGRCGG